MLSFQPVPPFIFHFYSPIKCYFKWPSKMANARITTVINEHTKVLRAPLWIGHSMGRSIEMTITSPWNQKFQTIYNYCWDMHKAQVKYSYPIVNTYSITINLIDILKMCSLQYLPSSSLLKMWNNLPLDLKRSNSLSIFKNRLLNSHFENYMTICNKPNGYSCKTN